MSEQNPDLQEGVITEIEEDLEEPPNYKVLLHNDDFTTKEFVVHILMSVFAKSQDDAIRLMLAVHRNGIGVIGVYPLEVAETKVKTTTELARENGFPLQTSLEKE